MDSKTKLSVLFVCHGNICRSPMAEFIMRRLVKDAGLSDFVELSSASTSDEETGNPVYPLAKRTLAIHGIGCGSKVAHRITQAMYDGADYVIVMDHRNLAGIEQTLGIGVSDKVRLLLDFLPADHPKHGKDIADPWYTRDFEKAYADILLGCSMLVEQLKKQLG